MACEADHLTDCSASGRFFVNFLHREAGGGLRGEAILPSIFSWKGGSGCVQDSFWDGVSQCGYGIGYWGKEKDRDRTG